MADAEQFKNRVISNLRACLISAQGGIQTTRLNNDYYQLLGEYIPFKKLGYTSLEAFLESLPNIAIKRKNGECFVEAKASETSSHISKFVERQKKTSSRRKKNSVPARRTTNARSNFTRGGPRFSKGKPSITQFRTLPSHKPPPLMQYSTNHPEPKKYNNQQKKNPSHDSKPQNGFQEGKKNSPDTNYRKDPPKNQKNYTPPERFFTYWADPYLPDPMDHSLDSTDLFFDHDYEAIPTHTYYNPDKHTDPPSKSQTTKPKEKGYFNQNQQIPQPIFSNFVPQPQPYPTNSLPPMRPGGETPRDVVLSSQTTNLSVTSNPAQKRLMHDKKKEPKKSFNSITPAPPSVTQKPNPEPDIKVSKYNKSFSLIEVPPDFPILSYVNKLLGYARDHKWPKPEFYILNRKSKDSKNRFICRTSIICVELSDSDYPAFKSDHINLVNLSPSKDVHKVNKIGECYDFSTYPDEFDNVNAAMESVAEKAYNCLVSKNAIKLPITEDHQLIVQRIDKIVSGKNQGIWSFLIISEYEKKYHETLPSNLSDILKATGLLNITKISDSQFIVHGRPLNNNKTPPPVPQSVATLPPLDLPDGDEWEVYVTKFSSVNQICLRLIGQEYSVRYEELATNMESLYANNGFVNASSIDVGGYYVYVEDKSICLRVLVTDIVDEKSVRVMFIDHGDTEIVPKSLLCNILPEFLQLPGQAIEAYLAGMDAYSVKTIPACLEYIHDEIVGKSYIAIINHRDPLSIVLADTSGGSDIIMNDYLVHTIQNSFRSLQLNQVGDVDEAFIVNVDHEGEIYLQMKSDTLTFLNEKLDDIGSGLYEIKDITDRNELEYLLSSNSVTFYTRTERALRVDIIKIYLNNEVEIRMKDIGCTDWVRLEQLFYVEEIEEVMSLIPPQALHVRLNEISPLLLTPGKLQQIGEMLPFHEPAIAKVVRMESVPVVELFKRTHPGNVLISINQSIVMRDQLEAKDKLPPIEKLRIDRRQEIHLVEEKFGLSKPDMPSIDEKYFDIYVIDCANPSNFTVQPVKYLPGLNELMKQMKLHYSKDKRPFNQTFKKGDICAVLSHDGFWYRAHVVKVFEAEFAASVKFFDYGNMDVVSISSMRPLEAEFKKLPFVGINAKLHGIQPTHKDWSVDDSLRARDLFNYKKFVSVIKSVSTEPNNTFSTLALEIIDTSSVEDVDIAHQFVVEGRASYK